MLARRCYRSAKKTVKLNQLIVNDIFYTVSLKSKAGFKYTIKRKKSMTNVYEKCLEFENSEFLLRGVNSDDCEALLKVYSDEQSVTFFNSDNCHGDDFHYTTKERMKQAIDFWEYSYTQKYFVRWTIVDKKTKLPIGTIELFHRKSDDCFNDFGILRLDLKSEYERKDSIQSILSLILIDAYKLFNCDFIATKAIKKAKERRFALQELGFTETNKTLIGHEGTEYNSYFERSINL